MSNRYLQIHRRLLFHWTKPPGQKLVPRSRSDREEYVDYLAELLKKGLYFSRPKESDHEYIVKGQIDADCAMICLTESIVGESDPHAKRYGSMALGFTRRFVMANRGRPVVYLNRSSNDAFTESMVRVLQAAASSSDGRVRQHAEFVAGWLKSYSMPYEHKKNRDKKAANARRKKTLIDDDDALRLRFGGLRGNLEDREWRIVAHSPGGDRQIGHGSRLSFEPGELGLLVMPDHQTLSIALRRKDILKRLYPEGRPSVCVISREILRSIKG